MCVTTQPFQGLRTYYQKLKPQPSTRAQSALIPPDKRGPQSIPNKEPVKAQRHPRMTSTQPARAQSDGPRPLPGVFNPRTDGRPE
ncbi:hypothetical protein LIER_18370 [Lithospermum erythrorhizon]|uniref:Uncharacterized protein n=1 Tax=Lithospermum erythrorhizon TaxID=34254 RepID=A0AAV3QJ79_LITER